MENENDLKVVFAPGCFDQFDGTQEELDALQKQIMEMFSGKTKEDLEAMSTRIGSLDDFNDEDLEMITRSQTRTLQ